MPTPYAGNSASYPPSVNVFSGGDAPNSTNFNTALEGTLDRTAWLRAQLTQQMTAATVGNFKNILTSVTVSGPLTLTLGYADWDPFLQHWSGFFQGGGDILDFATHSSGDVWTNINNTTISSLGILSAACDGVTGSSVCVFIPTGGATATLHTAYNGSRSGPTTQSFLNQLAQAVVFYLAGSGEWLLIGNEQSGGSFVGHAAASVTGTGAWVDGSSGLPVSWQSGSNHIAGFVYAKDPSGASTYTALVGMCGVTTGDTSRIMGVAGSFTDITPSFLTGKVLTSLAFNPVAGLWGALCYDNVSGAQFYTSPDQVTWTRAHVFNATFPGGTTAGLAVVNGIWAAQLVVANGGSGVTNPPDNDRVMLSPDGTTWTTASYAMSGSPGDTDAIGGVLGIARLVSSGNQLLAFNNGKHCFSHQSGFMTGGEY